MGSLLRAAATALALLTLPAQGQPVPPGSSPAQAGASLTVGFLPDPYIATVTAGGSVDAQTFHSTCIGFVPSRANFDLRYTSGGAPLTIGATSDADTTLAVRAPDGSWRCDDDSGEGLNPLVGWTNPTSGRYQIWVGRIGVAGATASATLRLTEIGEPPAPQARAMPDLTMAPAFGTVSLASGFQPDPHARAIQAGGSIDASALGSNCRGWIGRPPDYSVTWNASAGRRPLVFSVRAPSDTTLVINDTTGAWRCDDDSGGGFNPSITINSATSGRYDIWIGTFNAGPLVPSTLYVSQAAANLMPDVSSAPTFGSRDLYEGWTDAPDPYTHPLMAGGTINASVVGPQCGGWIARAPDYRVTYHTTGANNETLIFSVASSADTTLVINDPGNSWHCDDDSGQNGGNPAIRFPRPASGQYDIWVGTYGQTAPRNATLHVSKRHSQ